MIATAALILFALLTLAMGLGNTWSDETCQQRNALIFAERNRDYGAYRLRTGYGTRMGIAILGAIGILGAAVIIPLAIGHFSSAVVAVPRDHIEVEVELSRVVDTPLEKPASAKSQPTVSTPREKEHSEVPREVEGADHPVEQAVQLVDTNLTAAASNASLVWPAGASGTEPREAIGASGSPLGTAVRNNYEVDELPRFPGGEQAMETWVQRNLDLPPEVFGKDVVYVQFIVGLDGSVEDVKAVRGTQKTYMNAAERTVQSMPHWKPARMSGQDVPCRLTLPIRFEVR